MMATSHGSFMIDGRATGVERRPAAQYRKTR
jgi:hypothetical protein